MLRSYCHLFAASRLAECRTCNPVMHDKSRANLDLICYYPYGFYISVLLRAMHLTALNI